MAINPILCGDQKTMGPFVARVPNHSIIPFKVAPPTTPITAALLWQRTNNSWFNNGLALNSDILLSTKLAEILPIRSQTPETASQNL